MSIVSIPTLAFCECGDLCITGAFVNRGTNMVERYCKKCASLMDNETIAQQLPTDTYKVSNKQNNEAETLLYSGVSALLFWC